MAYLIVTVLAFSHAHDVCETYSKFSSNVCVNCQLGFIRDYHQLCIPLENSVSRSFVENCEEYSSDSVCTLCKHGYSLEESRCHPLCRPHCSCFEPFECIESPVRKLSCSALNCQMCDSTGYLCSVCNFGYTSLSGYCYLCIVSNCQACNSDLVTCTSCSNGYSLVSGSCSSLCTFSNCATCSSDYSTCTDCSSGYSLVNGICQESCYSINCLSCYSSSYTDCYKCADYYYLDSGYCYPCASGCAFCEAYDYCYSCSSGYTSNYNSCSDNTYTVSYGISIGLSIGGFAVICLIVIIIVWRRRRLRLREQQQISSVAMSRTAQPIAELAVVQNIQTPGYPTTPYYAQANYTPAVYPPPNNPQAIYPQPNNPSAQSGYPPNNPSNPPGSNPQNFAQVVPVVTLDQHGAYHGQNSCMICLQAFNGNPDVRMLPCSHCFHGRCVYRFIIEENRKNCPVCGRQYS